MININCIPEEVLKQHDRRKRMRRLIGAMLLALSMVILPFSMEWIDRARVLQRNVMRERLQVELKQIRQQKEEATRTALRLQGEEERAAALKRKRSWAALMRALNESTPDDLWYTNVTTDPAKPTEGGGGRVAASSAAGKPAATTGSAYLDGARRLLLEGAATDLSKPLSLIQNLQKSEMFSMVRLERSESDGRIQGGPTKFLVSCEW